MPVDQFPAVFYGPKGESQVFNTEDDVPAGWQDHPSKAMQAAGAESGVKTPVVSANGGATIKEASQATEAKSQTMTDPAVAAAAGVGGMGAAATGQSPASPAAPAPADEGNGDKAELDAHGHPWSADLHSATKSKTKAGLWRMAVGKARPEPKKGYPLDL